MNRFLASVVVLVVLTTACQPSPSQPPASIELATPDRVTRRVGHLALEGSYAHPPGAPVRVRAVVNDVATDCDLTLDRFFCDVLLDRYGENDVRVDLLANGTRVASEAVITRYEPPAGRFDVEVVFYDAAFTDAQLAAFDEAAALWESIILGDLEDFRLVAAEGEACPIAGVDEDATPTPAFDGTVDDILIYATSFTEYSDVLGLAGPCLTRAGGASAGMNLVGIMQFNTVHLADLEADGQLIETIVHEMGHVLGIGTNWEDAFHALLDYVPSDPRVAACVLADGFVPGGEPRYVGRHGRTAYARLGGDGSVPVDASLQQGTSCGHWDETRFGTELMTGMLNAGVENPLSELSIASLYDIGYLVDTTRAQPYRRLQPADARDAKRLDLAGREILLRPHAAVDPITGRPTDAPAR